MKMISNLVFLILFIFYTTAYGMEKIGKVEEIKGTAEALRTEGIIKLNINDPIFEKDTLRTRANSLLKVKFNDGKIIILTEKTKVSVDNYSNNKEFTAFRGGVRSIVEKLGKDESYKIKTTTAVAGIRGTDFAVLLFGTEMSIYVFSGIVNVQNPYGFVDVNEGFNTVVLLNQPPQAPVQTSDDKSKQILQLFSLQNQFDLNKIKETQPVVQENRGGSMDTPPIISPLPPNIPPSDTNPETLKPPKQPDNIIVPPYYNY